MSGALKPQDEGAIQRYNPEKGLQTITVSDAAIKHFTRAKDVSRLRKAVEQKIREQARYVAWRDSVVVPSRKVGKVARPDGVADQRPHNLPAADPGKQVAQRWRARLCSKADGKTIVDGDKLEAVIEDAQHRAIRICEQEKAGTVRGTEGTGEFERYTPGQYIEAARLVLGEIDLDPASNEMAQAIVKAKRFFTAADDGLAQEWHGRIWLNPPYHRELAPRFIDKLVSELEAKRVTATVMLTNNCTDTEWFLKAQRAASAICFTHGRIKFTTPRGDEVLPTQGQAFLYYGDAVESFAANFCQFGFGVIPRWDFGG